MEKIFQFFFRSVALQLLTAEWINLCTYSISVSKSGNALPCQHGKKITALLYPSLRNPQQTSLQNLQGKNPLFWGTGLQELKKILAPIFLIIREI